jgi:uncharacterized protein YdeI (YjbR/CyaY-like superfamily)
MPTRDPRIDAYIAKSPDFARPILEQFRAIVHDACPEVIETVKWGRPAFEYAGALMCSIAAFKHHCSIGFWKAPLLTFGGRPLGFGKDAQFSHLASARDLPARSALIKLVKQAARLNAAGVKESVMTASGPRRPRRPLPPPADLQRALAANKRAQKVFDSFPPSHKREYIEWITEAKRAETRAQRLATTLEWLAEGKPRNWKYMGKKPR